MLPQWPHVLPFPPSCASGSRTTLPWGDGGPSSWAPCLVQSLGWRQSPHCGGVSAGAGSPPASAASSKGRHRLSTARPCHPSVPLALGSLLMLQDSLASPLCFPPSPDTSCFFLLGQNSPAPDGRWALQGLCLIPRMTDRTPWVRGSLLAPCPSTAGALLTCPCPQHSCSLCQPQPGVEVSVQHPSMAAPPHPHWGLRAAVPLPCVPLGMLDRWGKELEYL